MGSWVRGLLAASLTFGACWSGAVWHWRATNRMPSASDLALYLLALPLAVLGAVWLWRKVAAARAAAPAPVAASSTPTAAAPAPAPAASLAVLGTALRTPHGDTADELAEALDAQTARASLDRELVDDHGYPLFSVRAAAGDAADGDWRADAERWLAARGHGEAHFGEVHWRALALAGAVTAELLDAAAQLDYPQADDDTPVLPLLRIAPLAPADWQPAQRAAAGAWLARTATDAGWPENRTAASVPPPGEPAAAAAALLSLLATGSANEAEPSLTIVLAFGSCIDQDVVDRMAGDGTLFTSARPQGLVPGEGAAGLLLACPSLATQLGADAAPRLSVASAARTASADAAGRPDATDLRRLAGRALAENALDAPAIALVVGDSDHRTSRVLELMALAHEDLPHLDAGSDVKTTGPACGQCGAVPFVTGLALAHHHARERDAAVLCVSNADPIHRSAALLRPAYLPAHVTPHVPPSAT
jgi:hypothetical protein